MAIPTISSTGPVAIKSNLLDVLEVPRASFNTGNVCEFKSSGKIVVKTYFSLGPKALLISPKKAITESPIVGLFSISSIRRSLFARSP